MVLKTNLGTRGNMYGPILMDLGKGRVFHSIEVTPKCPYLLLGRNLLSKVGDHMSFSPTWISVTNWEGKTTHILIIALVDKYKLFKYPNSGEKKKASSSVKLDIRNPRNLGQKQKDLHWTKPYAPRPPLVQLKANTVPAYIK